MRLPHLLLVFSLLLPQYVISQDTISALILGNSYTYTNNLPGMIRDLSNSKGNAFSFESYSPGGASFLSHTWDTISMAKIAEEEYDYLILQGQSVEMAGAEYGWAKHGLRSFPHCNELNHFSKVADTCHKTMLYLTWGRKDGHAIYSPPGIYGANYGEMQDQITENYSQLAEAINGALAPVGEAWQNVTENHPQIELYSSDGSHPSAAGTYLAACVFYTALFHEACTGGWKPASLSQSVADMLQAAADLTVVGAWATWRIDTSQQNCNSAPLVVNNAQWDDISPAIDARYYEIQFPNDQFGFVKGVGPSVWQSSNAGDQWTEIPLPAVSISKWATNLFDVTFLNADTGWFAVAGEEIDSTTLAWTPQTGNTADYVSFLHIYKTTNAGMNWEEVGPERMDHQISNSGSLLNRPIFTDFQICFNNASEGTLICSYGTENDTVTFSFWTDNGGQSWTQARDTIPSTTSTVWFEDAQTIYRSGLKGATHKNSDPQKMYKSEDRGASWNEMASIPNACCEKPENSLAHSFSAFAQVGTDTMIAINSLFNPTFYRSTNGGANWDSISTIPAIGTAVALVQPKSGVYYAAFRGHVNTIFVSYDLGQSWVLEAFFPYQIEDLTVTKSFIYVVGSFNGAIQRKALSWLTGFDSSVPPPASFSLFPNPTQGQVTLSDLPENAPIIVRNILGETFLESNANQAGQATLSLNGFSSGVYLISITYPEGLISKRLIVEKSGF